MSSYWEYSKQRWASTPRLRRWKVAIFVLFGLVVIHYIASTPNLQEDVLEAGQKLVSAAPTWDQIMDKVPWKSNSTAKADKEATWDPSEVKESMVDLFDEVDVSVEAAINADVGASKVAHPSSKATIEAAMKSVAPTAPIEITPTAEVTSIAAHNFASIPAQSSAIPDTPAIVPSPGADDDEYVAICLAIKDQRLDLPEFLIHHYHHIGIRRFYIMDDGSVPPLSEMEDFGIPRSALTFVYQDRATRIPHMYMEMYRNCIRERAHLHHWIAFIDADEFFEVTSPNETFRSILEEFEEHDDVGAIGVSWRVHSSSGLLTRPESCRKSFTTCISDDVENNNAGSDNRHVKSIVRPSKSDGPNNPHTFHMIENTRTVGEKMDTISTIAWRPVTRERLALHHYAVKSKEEYDEKMNRGNDIPKGWEFWNHIDTMSHVRCEEMVMYNP